MDTAFFRRRARNITQTDTESKETNSSSVHQSKPMAMARVMNRRSTIDAGDGDGDGGGYHRPRSNSQGGGGRRSLLCMPGNPLSSELSSHPHHNKNNNFNHPNRRASIDVPPPPRPTFLRRGTSSGHARSESFLRRGTSDRRLPSSSGQRRMSFDIFHHQQLANNGDLVRRLSLDHQLKVQEELANGGPISSSAVADFQEVFQQMKQENPTASMGALRQKTMARIADLKALREEEARRELELRHQREEEERLRNQNLAQKYVDKFVGKIRSHHHHDESSHQDTHHDNDEQYDTPNNNTSNNTEHEFTHFISVPTGTRASMIMSHRRTTLDSGTAPTSLAESNDETVEKFNFAPKKSVGDLSRMGGEEFSLPTSGDDDTINTKSVLDDKSVQSLLSQYSGLFIDESDIEEDVSGSGRRDTRRSKKTGDKMRRQQQQQENDTMKTITMPLKDNTTGEEIGTLTNVKDICEALSELNTSKSKSDLSEYTDYSGPSHDANGLIVGFTKQREIHNDEDAGNDGDDLIVGFGDRTKHHRSKEEEKNDEGEGHYSAW